MTNGELAVVLHAHLPYVRSAESGSLEEDWYFQALMECYLPLLDVLETSSKDKAQSPKLTISLSPTLLSLLTDEELNNRFPSWLSLRLDLLTKVPDDEKIPAEDLSSKILNQLNQWQNKRDLISRFAKLQSKNVLDLLTCAATHGYLPLLREHPETIQGQLRTAVIEHQRLLNSSPLGIWLPECAYYEGLDRLISEAGLRYAILDGHGLLHATPRPRYGIYAPICSKNGVAFFGRDSNATLPVWSASEGFPGDPYYREFHKDLGWELPSEQLKKIGLNEPRPLGLKLYRVTDQTAPLKDKKVYEPLRAKKQAQKHAKEYLQGRRLQLNQLSKAMDIKPLLVAPFDAELFGHWWFEGTNFLAELFRQSKQEQVSLTRLCDVLSNTPRIQLCNPCPSSWGKGGFHDYWLNESNAWIVPEWTRAGRAFVKLCQEKRVQELNKELTNQAARELLLAQSSDWSFILRAGTTTKLAKDRINLHLQRFWELMSAINEDKTPKDDWLKSLKQEDSIFPLIQFSDWIHSDE